MASETKTAVVKLKPSNQDGSSKGKIDHSINRKKIESSSRQGIDSKSKSITTTVKTEVKTKATIVSSKTATSTVTTKVKQKKVYTLAGQKFDPPEEREPLRIFYESLSKQIPSSEMAEFWMMEHGLLSPERSKKAFEKKQRRQKELRSGIPMKPSKPPSKPLSKPPSRPESSQKKQPQQLASKNGTKKRVLSDSDDDDDDFILSPKRRRF
ncbi:uncharacterized protein LOC133807391 [Humulus lupulus]|uniref:uncharacterized protein LOC133807391 n=1 Tax=Humulus lupulus TaxID=3486 RepID=UPI002B40FB45|nr:uncharacterized protein LOC133807391 [Humulus lupulus]